MTLSATLSAGGGRVEFILAIEGVGFPTVESTHAAFQGTVFVTSDAGATGLATLLGCTVVHGLMLPESVSESFDPSTMVHEYSGLSATVVDSSNWWLTYCAPLKSHGSVGTLDAVLYYGETTVDIDTAGMAAVPAEGDTVWICGREAVLLGARAAIAGTRYRYSSCTRAYLGTPHGRVEHTIPPIARFGWPEESIVRVVNPYWYGRRAILYAHTPSDAATNLTRLWSGVLRNVSVRDNGSTWDLLFGADRFGGMSSSATPASEQKVWSQYRVNGVESGSGQITWVGNASQTDGRNAYYIDTAGTETGDQPYNEYCRRIFNVDRGTVKDEPWEDREKYALGYAYAYRNRVVGGTVGVKTTIDATPKTPQAYVETVDGASRYMIDGVWSINGIYNHVLYKVPDDWDFISHHFRIVVSQAVNSAIGNDFEGAYQRGQPIRYMLSNYCDSRNTSRFCVSGTIRTNPIDLLLIFLTSMPNEYRIEDATGGSGTTLTFAAIGSVNQWTGYALHCVDGVNIGEARVIASNTATDVTLVSPFSAAPGVGDQYQVRNTIYDVLPLGWGLCVHNTRIDVASFERVRSTYLSGASIGEFAIGDSTSPLDVYDLLYENICRPYGLLLYAARDTGILTCRYVGSAAQSGIDANEARIEGNDIIELGSLRILHSLPTTKCRLRYRGASAISIYSHVLGDQSLYGVRGNSENVGVAGGNEASTIIELPALEASLPDSGGETVEYSAMFDSAKTIGWLRCELVARLLLNAIPTPVAELLVDIKHALTIDAGSLIEISDEDVWNPPDPYTGTRGWSTDNRFRVISKSIRLSEVNPGVQLKVQMLRTAEQGLVAPAAEVTAKGAHGTGTEYFAVVDNNVTIRYGTDDARDWDGFAVGDLIELRDINGALKEAETIESFGSNEAATPALAASSAVNVVGAIASAIATGDYITFAPWVTATVTDNMDDHVAWSGTDDMIDSDSGLEYG